MRAGGMQGADDTDPEDRGTSEDMPTERTAHIRQEKSLDDVLDSLK
jgi:hypothetical protein